MFKSGRIRGVMVVALAAATLPILAACSAPASNSGSSEASGEPINIAMIMLTGGDIGEAYQRGAESVVEKNGGSVTFFNANFDPQAQVTQCQDAITSGRYNAIIISPVDPLTARPCITAAKAANIPVGTLEAAVGEDPYSLEPQVDGVVAVVGAPLTSLTKLDGEMLKGACQGKNPCEVIAEIASATDRYTNDRVQAVEDEFGPEIKVVQRFSTGFDPGEVARQIPDLIIANPGADVFFSASDLSAVAAIPAIEAAGLSDDLKITGNGGSGSGADAVAAGTIFATLGTWPEQSGAFLANALTQSVNGEEVNPVGLDMLTADDPQPLTKESVADFTAEWGLTDTAK